MKTKQGIGGYMFETANCIFMALIMMIMIYPIINVFAVSLSNTEAITAGRVYWIPQGLNFGGYKIVLRNAELLIAYKNTISYTFVGTIIMLVFTSLAAYPLAINDFIIKKPLVVLITITMFFNGGLVPTYLVMRDLGLLNSFWVMVLPGCVSAYNVFVFRTFFQGIPSELRESAQLDGANDLMIWYKIFLPLSKPILATFALFGIVGHWNSWFGAMIYLKDEARYPLQMILRRMLILDEIRGGAYADSEVSMIMASMNADPKNVQMAAVVVAMFPILFIYPFVQKYFVKGIMIGSVKG